MNSVESHHLHVQKSARYLTVGDLSEARHILVVLHGYGQSVQRLASKFSGLGINDVAVVIPEGLHRFYTKGFSGEVGASWMTKEDRETDIADYVNYLDMLYDAMELKSKDVSVLGFSQGAATACRWVVQGKIKAINLILWAGLVPPDLELGTAMEPMRELELVLAHSRTDAFRTDEMWTRQYQLLDQYQLVYSEFEYSGGHRIPIDEFKRLWKQLNPPPSS